ncbi:hypothetical protein O3M35_001295 [Rhynocoris fuscipes]|uniref:Uncharacterized protein n=1 Tax=Rhynocoris fuscipes TaxID=488301 RepID=A0AAW1DT87_9HEMI
MLKLMSTSDEDGSDTVKDFLTTGRVGRRNALPDILSDHALTNTADLPDKLMQLSTNGKFRSITLYSNKQYIFFTTIEKC